MAKRSRRSRILWAAAGVVVLALLVYAFLPKPILVDSEKVERRTMRVTLDAEGRTRIRNLYVVSMPVSGELERVGLREGDRITQGRTLGTVVVPELDPGQRSEIDRRIEAASAAEREAASVVDRATASLMQLKRESDRLRPLAAEGAVAAQDLERSTSAAEVAERDLAAARHRREAAAAQVAALRATRGSAGSARFALTAPADGRILRLFEQNRRALPAGTPVASIGDPRGIEIVIDVLSQDATQVHPGDRVVINGWGGDKELEGRVLYVEPAAFTKVSSLGIEEQRVNIIASISSPPAELGDGYRVDASVVLWEAPSVLVAPMSALFRDGDAWHAFVVRAGRAHKVQVDIGRRNSFEAEIVSGLTAGDVVITHPSDQVSEGARVEL